MAIQRRTVDFHYFLYASVQKQQYPQITAVFFEFTEIVIKSQQRFRGFLFSASCFLVELQKTKDYFLDQKLSETHNLTHQIQIDWHSYGNKLLISISFGFTALWILLKKNLFLSLLITFQKLLKIFDSLSMNLNQSPKMSPLALQLFLRAYLLIQLLLQLISFGLDGLVLRQISKIVVLGLKVSFSELTVNAFLNNCVVLQQHLAIVFLQHRQLMLESFGVFSQQLNLPRKHLYSVFALVFYLLHPFPNLELTLLLELLLHFHQFFLKYRPIISHLSGHHFLLSRSILLECDIVVSCSPQIFMRKVELLLQRNDFSVLF